MNLQLAGEDVPHHQDVVLLVVDSQSVHGVVMRKKGVTLSFNDVLKRERYHRLILPKDLRDGIREECYEFVRRLPSRCISTRTDDHTIDSR